MAGFKDFREIVAWQLANELKLEVDRFLARPAFKLRFKFCEQLDDAARSGPRNIAEGFARFKHKEFAQFVRVAKGSEAEVLNHFIDAHDQRLITKDDFLMTEHLTAEGCEWSYSLSRINARPPTAKWKPKPPKPPDAQ